MQKSNTESAHREERVATDLIKPPAGVSRPANLREEMGSLVGGDAWCSLHRNPLFPPASQQP